MGGDVLRWRAGLTARLLIQHDLSIVLMQQHQRWEHVAQYLGRTERLHRRKKPITKKLKDDCIFQTWWAMTSEGDVPQGADGGEAGSGPVDPVAGKTVAEILGEIVWLMTQDPAGREMKVAEIEALVIPAILERRFHIQYARIPVANGQAERLQPFTAEIYAVKDGGKSRLLLAKYSLPMRSNTERIES